ncbi:ankyrin repeat domain-containing protein, partial [Acidobacteria bacterium AH-259-D05]|nr:ankyrin repeat domain-containing protein [Acidobacteria bacterium AH-259-D05]
EHPNVATVLENYADLLRQMERDAEAKKLEERARAIRVEEQEARQTEPVLLLKKAGQDVKSELIETEKNGQTARVKTLLDARAAVDAKDNLEQTALMRAAFEGQTGIVRALLEAGANVNAKTDHGVTSLMNAAGRGHTETVRVLLDAGADVNAKTAMGVAALMVATQAGHTEIVELLKKAGAKE